MQLYRWYINHREVVAVAVLASSPEDAVRKVIKADTAALEAGRKLVPPSVLREIVGTSPELVDDEILIVAADT
jgi:hypothetical protein